MMKIVPVAAAAALLAATFAVATPAVAITYTSTRMVDVATINLSITTDGTLGILTQANITDWTIATFVPPPPNLAFLPVDTFVMTSANSTFDLQGNNLSATATKLNYDFSGTFPTYFQFVGPRPDLPGLDNFYGGGAADNNNIFNQLEYVYSRFDFPITAKLESRIGFGVVTLATAPAVGGIPEPASWAMLIAGFGLVGAMARRRRVAVVA